MDILIHCEKCGMSVMKTIKQGIINVYDSKVIIDGENLLINNSSYGLFLDHFDMNFMSNYYGVDVFHTIDIRPYNINTNNRDILDFIFE